MKTKKPKRKDIAEAFSWIKETNRPLTKAEFFHANDKLLDWYEEREQKLESLIEMSTRFIDSGKSDKKYFDKTIGDLESKLEKAIEVLEFYAGYIYEKELEDRLGYVEDNGNWVWSEPEILDDSGDRARQVLKELKGE